MFDYKYNFVAKDWREKKVFSGAPFLLDGRICTGESQYMIQQCDWKTDVEMMLTRSVIS